MAQKFGMKDGGKRTSYATGAVREPQDVSKGRYDLLSPIALRRLAQHYATGAEKYGASNMRKGLPLSRYLDSGMRHFTQLLAGDTSEDHCAAVLWNLCEFLHTQDRIVAKVLSADLDDLQTLDPHR